MLKWFKNLLKTEESVTIESSTPIQEELILSEEIQQYLDTNGPETTLSMLIGKLSQGLNSRNTSLVFSQYYDGIYSKKDVLDRYDELVQIDNNVLIAIKKLGNHFTPELANKAIPPTSEFCIYPSETICEFVQCLTSGELTIKSANTKLWKFYFNYVREFLDIAKKVGIKPEEYVPKDEIEATLIMLLKAEQKQKINL